MSADLALLDNHESRLALFESMVVTVRARRAVRLTDAAGVCLSNFRSLLEHAEGIILCDDARDAGAMCAWDAERVERAAMRREAAMYSRSIERHLARAADDAEMAVLLERGCLPTAVAFWRSSQEYAKLASSAVVVCRRMRAALGNDLLREYGAARSLAGFFCAYRRGLEDALTRHSIEVTAPPALCGAL